PDNDPTGVISPTAAISSIPYTPEASISFMRYLQDSIGEPVWGKYGFYDAYSESENCFPQRYLAIDQGPIVVMIQNYKDGFIWDLFMRAEDVQAGLKKLGFDTPMQTLKHHPLFQSALKHGLFFYLTSMVSLNAHGQTDHQRPNVIFIMSDDHAEQAISAYGHPISRKAPTPNIDRIAKEGALFLNNYCSNSICGPSRAAILTGKHSHKNGFMQNGSKGFDGTQQTLPKILQQHGYETAVIGKWHLISKPTGFDHWEILNDQGDYYNPYFITEQDTVRHMGYVTDLITELTTDWLDNRDKSKPFFLMMHH